MTEHFFTKKLVLSTLFAALACAAAMSIRIPTPSIGGYIHPGDIIVILYGVSLDLVSAFLTADISSCTADLLEGYFIYVPIIFVIRGLVASSASHAYRSLRARGINPYAAVAGCGVINIVLVTGGHCMYEAFLYGLGVVLAGASSNIIRGISGPVISNALCPILQRPLFMALKA